MTQGVHVIQTVGSIAERAGGPPRTVTSLCSALRQTGISVDLVSGTSPDDDALLLAPFAPVLINGQRAFGPAFDSLIAQRSGVPVLIHDNGIWATSNRAVMAAVRARALPYVISPHGMLEPWALAYHAYRKQLAWRLYQRRALENASALLATAESERAAIRARVPRVPIAMIANGVDCPAQVPATDPASTTLLYMSRIHPKKNLSGLLDAWAMICADPSLSTWRLAIAGPDEGGHLAQVQAQARRLGLSSRIDFIGVVADADKARHFASAAVFILPSFSENFGIVVAEALAAGLPVIATHGAPWGEVVARGCGWWVAPTVAALADAMRQAMALPLEARRAMGVRGHAYVAGAFGWPRIAQDTARLYRWLLHGGNTPDFVDA